MKTRIELLKSKGYWTSELQLELYRKIEEFMKQNHMNRTQLAEHLGCSKGYVSQLLNGDFDNKMSKFVELCLAIGKIPEVTYIDVDVVVNQDSMKYEDTTTTGSFYPVQHSVEKVIPFSIIAA